MMNKKLLAILVASTTLVGLTACQKADNAAGATASGGKASGDVIRIATGSPLSGGQAAAGQDFLNGAKLAADELNAQGGIDVGGKKYKIEIVAEDDAGDPKTGATVAQKTADDKSIVAVVGHYNSGVTMVANPIYARAGIPSLTVSTNPDVTVKAPKLEGGLASIYRVSAHDGMQGPALATFAQEKGVKKFAILDDATAYGKGIADQVDKKAKELGVEVTVRESATDKTTDFKAVLTKIKAAGADGILWGGYDDTAASLAKQARELGITAFVFLPDAACTPNYLKLAGAAGEGSLCSSTVAPVESMQGGADFVKKYEAAFKGQTVQAFAPLTYDAVMVLADTIKKAGTVDAKKIAETLPTITHSGMTGNMAFLADGERKDAEVAIMEAKGGHFALSKMVK
ncbi:MULTISPECIES: branched-chain amino acid ABC transporter substrate-binding protein [unclassified Acinetobacter]|uniref:branched-chain amino acid ABC transporter substrate-binding protein n=1 Tax=unclassified Acinetobacter TaxID=196816 RepID=UPI0035B7319A